MFKLPTKGFTRFQAVLAVGIATTVLLGFAACTAKAPSGKVPVMMAIPTRGADFWPSYVAIDKGFYAGEGLDVKLNVLDPNIIPAALIGGGADIAYADSTQLLFAVEKHANLVAVGLSTDRQPYRLMAGPAIKTVADLKGKKIGVVSAIDIYTYVIKVILRKDGLDPDKDVEWVVGGSQTRRFDSLVAGRLDAGLFSTPADGRLKRQGFNGLAFTPDTFPDLTLSAQTVRRDWAQQHGDTLRHLLRAEAQAVRWLNDPANKSEAIQILAKEGQVTPDDAAEAYDYFVGQHVWPDACIHPSGLANVVKIMRANGQLTLTTQADVSHFTDQQWCEK